MSDITVTPMGPSRFGVQVDEGHQVTSHKVAVPPGLLDDLGLGGVDPADVVYETFEFLLEREPATSIRGDFPLDQVAQHFPEYYDELKARLGS